MEETHISLDSFWEFVKSNKKKLDVDIWFFRLKNLILLLLLFGIILISSGINSKIYWATIIGSLIVLVILVIVFWYSKFKLNRKVRLSILLVRVADLMRSYKSNKNLKKELLFYLKYLNNFFLEDEISDSFFEKESEFYRKCNNLALRINFAIKNNLIDYYDTDQIKKLGWLIYKEDGGIYKEIDKTFGLITEEDKFKSIRDKFREFLANKYTKFMFGELIIIFLVLIAHLIFPSYVEKNNVFWAIIILTAALLSIIFTKR